MKRWLVLPWMLLILLYSCRNNSQQEQGVMPMVADTTSEDPAFAAFRAEPFERTFSGKLDNTYPITMRLTSADGHTLKGNYQYDGKMGGVYQLSGSVSPGGAFTLQEKDKQGNLRSSFDGFFVDRHEMEGLWSAAEGGAPVFFSLKAQHAPSFVPQHDSVPGYRGLLATRRAVYCPQCDCAVRMTYPQWMGITSPDAQDALNRAVRSATFEALEMRCSEFDSSDREIVTFVLQPGLATEGFFSGVLLDAKGKPVLGYLCNLTEGTALPADDFVRDRASLETFLRSENQQVSAATHCWMDAEGIRFFLPGTDPVTIPWSHPSITSWFRNLPAVPIS